MALDPRHVALNVLVAWHKGSGTLDHALAAESDRIEKLSPKDKKLCHALIFGCLRHRQYLDWILDHHTRTSITKVPLTLLYLLRIGLFQIIFMERVPDFAAINTAVNIAARAAGHKKKGFINAVLRKASQSYQSFELPDPKKTPAQYLTVKYGLPLWLSRKWISDFDFQNCEKLGRAINEIPVITVRTNTLKTDRPTLLSALKSHVKDIQLTCHSPEGLSFNHPDKPIHAFTAFKEGWFQVQDEAAQIISLLLEPKPGEHILDACAGMGGKTAHIAQLMKNRGKITAMDTGLNKLHILETEMDRLGIGIVTIQHSSLLKTSVKETKGYFDRVLIDAPCTGLGVLGRNPDTRWKKTFHDIKRMAAQQKKMLNAGANLVKPGGILLFSVCSCEKEENEMVVDAFLSKRKDFSIDKNMPSGMDGSLITDRGFLKTYTEVTHMDGFFAARFIRKEEN